MKQTPVPLPAKYLAAMAKPKPKPNPETPKAPAKAPEEMESAPRISTTPIPLPNLPNLPRGDKGPGEAGGAPREGIELPDVPADSSAFVERMISKLHRVSGVEG